ncbi:TnpV protein [Enterococcus faecium]|uniref:TnpV protein n=2 Tax=Enterococcus faecium TaxID=1352 RepID=UPI0008DC7628|nr:TnpV protein [Enterococcus faecium]OHY83905.1 TnpV protein [Enterococcus faecium]OHY87431.1 TnpV protein [Enterococcus faecium]PHL09864.1 TnpV protein [Enterococcus faecium]PHL17940.1 TnpV protein [Enterococcus faecium]QZK95390.1 TnpV protein [Enterococcus faecium]
MAKTIFEQLGGTLGGTYEKQGDYLVPCLTLPAEEEKPIGIYGQRHLWYLRECRRVTYINLLTSGKLNAYLADIDTQAQDMLFRLVKELSDRQGITERLKAENQLEWVGRMNNIRNAAEEIINTDLIYR